MTTRQRHLLVIFLLLPTLTFAEGQGGMDYFIWIIDFVKVFGLWSIGALIFLFIFKKIRQQGLLKKQIFFFWGIILFSAFFHWSMTTYDPHPYEGPIDSFVHKDQMEKSRIEDSLELINGMPDSTIETTIASIDTNEVGVYIWLNHKRKFVRKLTPNLYQRQNDSLTMSIVRQWKKE